MSRSLGQGQGHRSKKRVSVSQAFTVWRRQILAVTEFVHSMDGVHYNSVDGGGGPKREALKCVCVL